MEREQGTSRGEKSTEQGDIREARRYDYQGDSKKKIPAGEKESESVAKKGSGRTEGREDRMNANREPKTSTEALSFTGGGATIANTFSLTLAL